MLSTFLIVSLRRINRFQPSRVRLARVAAQTLETELGGASKRLNIEVGKGDEYRYQASDNSLSTKLDIQLVDLAEPVAYIPFMEGVERLLKILRPGELASQTVENQMLDAVASATNKSQIVDDTPNQTVSGDQTEPQITTEENCKIFTFTETDSFVFYRFDQHCKGTISQLQFWLTRGLEAIEAQKSSPDSREYLFVRELVSLLVVYLRPMLFFVVKPVLESDEPVQYVHIAQRYHRVFGLLESISEKAIDGSAVKELRGIVKVDWVELWSVLYDDNGPLIDKRYGREFKKQSPELQKIIQVQYMQIRKDHDLIKFEEFTDRGWSNESRVLYQNWGILSDEHNLRCTPRTRQFKVDCHKSQLIFQPSLPTADPEQNNPCNLVVDFGLRTLQISTLLSNENFVVVADSEESQIWFATTKAVWLMLESASQRVERKLEMNSSELFQHYKIADPIKCHGISEAELVSWRLLQHGIVQIYLANHGWTQYGYESCDSFTNDYHSEMLYIDLSDLTQKPSVSRFDLTTQLFNQVARLQIEKHKFAEMSFESRNQDQFFISFLEVNESYCYWGNANLHLGLFTVKDKRITALNYSVTFVTRDELALLDYESRQAYTSYCDDGWLQWLLKQGKYFSLAFLTSHKYCVWVHVFHNNSFLPIGRKRQLIPGLTPFGMSKGLIVNERSDFKVSVAITERKQILSEKKTVYRVFALTVKW